jgi:hypothetical protein
MRAHLPPRASCGLQSSPACNQLRVVQALQTNTRSRLNALLQYGLACHCCPASTLLATPLLDVGRPSA